MKPRLSGKRRALEGCSKVYWLSAHFFCHSYSTRAGSKTRKLSRSKEILMVLREVDACPLPETPRLIVQLYSKVERNYKNVQMNSVIWNNLNTIEHFAKYTQFHRASLLVHCKGRLVTSQSFLQGQKWIRLKKKIRINK